jgi:hypothetical protein
MSGPASPALGYNNNVRHNGRVFHLQTEDSGIRHPHIITHLFVDGGRILKSVKVGYREHLGSPELGEIVRALMKEQHKRMYLALRAGEFDVLAGEVAAPQLTRPSLVPRASLMPAQVVPMSLTTDAQSVDDSQVSARNTPLSMRAAQAASADDSAPTRLPAPFAEEHGGVSSAPLALPAPRTPSIPELAAQSADGESSAVHRTSVSRATGASLRPSARPSGRPSFSAALLHRALEPSSASETILAPLLQAVDVAGSTMSALLRGAPPGLMRAEALTVALALHGATDPAVVDARVSAATQASLDFLLEPFAALQ